MSDRTFLAWPFFEDRHRQLADALDTWCSAHITPSREDDVDTRCRELVAKLGAGGWLKHCVIAPHGGSTPELDVRTLALTRETLARHDALADFSFAMQGLGAGPISLYGTEQQRARYLPDVARGKSIAAFALSEPGGGSDVSSMSTTAERDGDAWVLKGEKTWISNGGIADFYVVFARVPHLGPKTFGAFVVDASAPGLEVAERLHMMAPHPLARVVFHNVRIKQDAMIGDEGKGLRVALGTLDVFRTTVGAAALGMARRALDEARTHAATRVMFGGVLADLQLTQSRIAAMATDVDTSALLIYRAAWTRDVLKRRVTREAAMAKWHATEAAQRVIDGALQLFGGQGVLAHHPVERLYREIRALRVYEGASEVQQLVIAGQVLRDVAPEPI